MIDKRLRSITKALSWRILATMTTFAISFFVTRSVVFATSISMIEVVAKIILYYFHERAWQFFDFWQHQSEDLI
ncbi:MAG: DUF2061 domain-containing protein [Gammaproteobacteria bacterium]